MAKYSVPKHVDNNETSQTVNLTLIGYPDIPNNKSALINF